MGHFMLSCVHLVEIRRPFQGEGQGLTRKLMELERPMLNLAIIGCGYWGPNYIRIFNGLPEVSVTSCCDIDKERLGSLKSMYPRVMTTTKYQDVFENKNIDAVCI